MIIRKEGQERERRGQCGYVGWRTDCGYVAMCDKCLRTVPYYLPTLRLVPHANDYGGMCLCREERQ